MTKLPKPSFDDDVDENTGADLPVDPDEGSALIPDEERVINVPS